MHMHTHSTMGLWEQLVDRWKAARGRYLDHYKYSPLPGRNAVADAHQSLTFWASNHRRVLQATMAAMAFLVLYYLAAATVRVVTATSNTTSCDSVQSGYTCSPETSHYWGQYSPYFRVDAGAIPTAVPDGCTLTFAQVLSRHGARDPTASKSAVYNTTIRRIQAAATGYGDGYDFLADYVYALGADQLTVFGQQELVNSGAHFFARYGALAQQQQQQQPFVRASGQDRVVQSARNWTQGFRAAAGLPATGDGDEAMVIISEAAGSNNTLDHGLCTAFETGAYAGIGDDAQSKWLDVFSRRVTARLNANLPGANVTATETVYLMDMCAYDTVADADGRVSPFCGLFGADEWRDYDYLQALGKYYGHGAGNPLGPTQGVGFANELVARLTGRAVADATSTNRTLDGDAATFPLGRALYADFSHDNDMTGIMFALGLYNNTAPLANTTRQGLDETDYYSASVSVAFAARMYVEKMTCGEEEEELVRVLVNDRVRPLQNCDADELGRCTLSKFVDSLSFARQGGHWNLCFS